MTVFSEKLVVGEFFFLIHPKGGVKFLARLGGTVAAFLGLLQPRLGFVGLCGEWLGWSKGGECEFKVWRR